jgi:hypothetical protein
MRELTTHCWVATDISLTPEMTRESSSSGEYLSGIKKERTGFGMRFPPRTENVREFNSIQSAEKPDFSLLTTRPNVDVTSSQKEKKSRDPQKAQSSPLKIPTRRSPMPNTTSQAMSKQALFRRHSNGKLTKLPIMLPLRIGFSKSGRLARTLDASAN